MNNKQIKQRHHTIYQPLGTLPFLINPDSYIPETDSYWLVKEFVESFLFSRDLVDLTLWSEIKFSAVAMLEALLFSFTNFHYSSLRELTEHARFDIRVMAFFNSPEVPCHMTFKNFIDKVLFGQTEPLLAELNEFILLKDKNVDTSTLYLDGTKMEANANKNTFVWIRSVDNFEPKCREKMYELIAEMNKYFKSEGIPVQISLLRALDETFLFKTGSTLRSIIEKEEIKLVHGKGNKKHQLQRYLETYEMLSETLLKYIEYRRIAGDRMSFSKTDHSATFMHMKYDYYCNTGVFKPGYNVQFGNHDGYVSVVLVTSSCNDMKDFIPTVEKYKEMYGRYPDCVPADAGYGSYENYCYCKEHGIQLMMKYPTYSKEKKRTKKDKFKSYRFEKAEDGTPICPAGKRMNLENESISETGDYVKVNMHYRGEGCKDCPLRSQCTKSSEGRTLTISPAHEKYKEEVRENLSTKEGQKKMRRRSIFSEGAFGIMKQDHGYSRLRRRGTEKVKMELELVALGQNMHHLSLRLLDQMNQIPKDYR